MAAPGTQEIDTLTHLEERVQKAVLLVQRLRQEKEALTGELAASQQALNESQQSNVRLTEELEAMRSERHQVRNRIERLLGHIDELGAA